LKSHLGNWTVTGNLTTANVTLLDTANLTVISPHHIIISPPTANITAGDNITYTADAYDQSNNWLGNVTPLTKFSIDSGAGGNWTGLSRNTYTSQNTGNWTVTGNLTSLNMTDTANLTVNTGPLEYIIISPDSANITAGDNVTYTAKAFDQSNNSLGDVTVNTTFTIDSAAVGNWTGLFSNTYISEKAGNWTVTGNYSGLTDTANLTVNPGPTVSLDLTPDGGVTTFGPQIVTVTAYDSYGNVATSYNGTVNFTSSDPLANLPSDYTFIPADAGTHTFIPPAFPNLSGCVALFTSGNQTVTVIDTQDVSLTDSEIFEIFPPHHIEIAPHTTATIPTFNQTYVAVAYDQSGNPLAEVTPWTTFSIDPAAGGNWTLQLTWERNFWTGLLVPHYTHIYTAENIGNWTVTGNYSGLTDTANLTVSIPTDFEILPSAATIIPGANQTYTANVYIDVVIPFKTRITIDVTPLTNFSIDPAAGGNWTGGTYTANNTGNWTGNTYTAENTGNWTVTGNFSNPSIPSLFILDTAKLSVVSPHHIGISPPTATIIAGTNQTYTADAYDQSDNWLGDVTAITTFSIEPGAGGNWTDSTYTSENADNWTVTGNLTLLDMTDTANLTVVNPNLVDHIEISPPTANITAGDNITYTAAAFDKSNSWLLDVTKWTTFSIDPAAGGSWMLNTYTSQKSGNWTVTGNLTLLGMSDNATLTVNPGTAVSLDLTPDDSLAIIGTSFNVTVTAYDSYSNVATSYNGTANFTSSDPFATLPTDFTFTPADAGTHTFSGGVTLFTSGNQTVTVIDTQDSLLTDTSTFTVIPPPHHIKISPPTATVITGASQAYTANAYDQADNWLLDVTKWTTFSIDPAAGGSWTQTGRSPAT